MAVGYLTNCQSLFSLFAIITSGKGKSRKNLSNRSRKLIFFFQNVVQLIIELCMYDRWSFDEKLSNVCSVLFANINIGQK